MAYIKKMVMQGFKSFAKRTEVPFDKGINTIIGPNGSGKCIMGESLVTLGDGTIKRIDELVNAQLEKNGTRTEDGFIAPENGIEIMCLDVNTLKTSKKIIKAFIKKISPEKLLAIRTKSGREITATAYHPFFILKDGEVTAAKAEELKTGIRIAAPRNISFVPENKYFTELLDSIKLEDNFYIPCDEEIILIVKELKKEYSWKELANKIGITYYALKGILDKQAVHFYNAVKIFRYAGISEQGIAQMIGEIRANGKNTKFSFENSPAFARFFGYLLAEGRLAESSQIWFTNGDKEIVQDYVSLARSLFKKEPLVREYKPHCWDVIIYSEPLKKLLKQLGMGSRTEEKLISNTFLKHSTNKEIAELLNGLYCGDGYVSKSAIEITTKSKMLARGIESCLLRLGMIPRTRKVEKGIKSTGFRGKYFSIALYGVEMMKKFSENIQLIQHRKRKAINERINVKQNSNVDLIEVNDIVKKAVKEQFINVKNTKKEYPILDSYCYTDTIPSRNGLSLLLNKVFLGQTLITKKLNKLANSDIFWDEVIEMKEVDGSGWVYDLCVEGHHNFVANNLFAHNSNVSDALCFVLGRLSIKSMRAAKAKNLIFMGSKIMKPAKEACVEVVFDNKDKAFNMDKDEVHLKRIVRTNGQSIYKIGDETKTRGEIMELLAHAGIDPYGFNIILQGQIQSIVRIQSEERRKIIEEVAGISIYETRKEKSLHELEKTEEKLKEINAVLRERNAYLRNLEEERKQALKYKELEKTVSRAKASILNKRKEEKEKELKLIRASLDKNMNEKDRRRADVERMQNEVEQLVEKINSINKHIQQSTGIEQEQLHTNTANLKAEIEGLKVRKENYEHRGEEIERRISEMTKSIPSLEEEIEELREKSPMMAKKAEELRKKKDELTKLEEERKKMLTLKTELNGIKERIKDKEKRYAKVQAESEELVKMIEEQGAGVLFKTKDSCEKAIADFSSKIADEKREKEEINEKRVSQERIISVAESEIQRLEKIKKDVGKIDVCPLCQSKITEGHVGHVVSEADANIAKAKNEIENARERMSDLEDEKEDVEIEIGKIEKDLAGARDALVWLRSSGEKQQRIKILVEEEKQLGGEIKELNQRRENLEGKTSDMSRMDERYDNKLLEIEEISSRTEEDIDTTLLYKNRDLENTKNVVKRSKQDAEEIKEQIDELAQSLEEKEGDLEKAEKQEEELNKKFNKLFADRDGLQKKIQEKNIEISDLQNQIRQIEEQMNYLKVGKAKLEAEEESVLMELEEFIGIELLPGSIEALKERMQKAQFILQQIGSINMRALEVYEDVKKEYDKVQERVDVLQKEKEEILKIVEEIDKKKKKTFMKTFSAINELFTENFNQLSSKGQAYLELENKEDIFAGGVTIVVKLAKGKYFDVTSLSGGEQTLVALSLLFAIQEYKPYHFYIFDEIDAALDKRNSERLAALLEKHMQRGQYIIVTHNDAIIMNSHILYGVSMHEGISKILSMKVDEPIGENKG